MNKINIVHIITKKSKSGKIFLPFLQLPPMPFKGNFVDKNVLFLPTIDLVSFRYKISKYCSLFNELLDIIPNSPLLLSFNNQESLLKEDLISKKVKKIKFSIDGCVDPVLSVHLENTFKYKKTSHLFYSINNPGSFISITQNDPLFFSSIKEGAAQGILEPRVLGITMGFTENLIEYIIKGLENRSLKVDTNGRKITIIIQKGVSLNISSYLKARGKVLSQDYYPQELIIGSKRASPFCIMIINKKSPNFPVYFKSIEEVTTVIRIIIKKEFYYHDINYFDTSMDCLNSNTEYKLRVSLMMNFLIKELSFYDGLQKENAPYIEWWLNFNNVLKETLEEDSFELNSPL